MEMPKLFQIGDMAKLFHISVSSLRYYESLGLLTPERVDPDTGYRYYSVRQFEVLNTIRYLRELDMPLPEISDFLKNRDIDRMEEKPMGIRGNAGASPHQTMHWKGIALG